MDRNASNLNIDRLVEDLCSTIPLFNSLHQRNIYFNPSAGYLARLGERFLSGPPVDDERGVHYRTKPWLLKAVATEYNFSVPRSNLRLSYLLAAIIFAEYERNYSFMLRGKIDWSRALSWLIFSGIDQCDLLSCISRGFIRQLRDVKLESARGTLSTLQEACFIAVPELLRDLPNPSDPSFQVEFDLWLRFEAPARARLRWLLSRGEYLNQRVDLSPVNSLRRLPASGPEDAIWPTVDRLDGQLPMKADEQHLYHCLGDNFPHLTLRTDSLDLWGGLVRREPDDSIGVMGNLTGFIIPECCNGPFSLCIVFKTSAAMAAPVYVKAFCNDILVDTIRIDTLVDGEAWLDILLLNSKQRHNLLSLSFATSPIGLTSLAKSGEPIARIAGATIWRY